MGNKKYYVLVLLIIIIIVGIFYLRQNKLKINNSNNTEIKPPVAVDNQFKTDIVKNKDPNIVNYEKSLNVWNELKKQNSNSYTYETSFTSWTGYTNKTIISIINGVPISRSYEEFIYRGPDSKVEKLDSFVEDSSNLNSNDKGVKAVNIEEIYKQCISDYLKVDPKVNEISFEVDSNGIMSYCGYIPKNCMDDCDKSVRIENFKWTK